MDDMQLEEKKIDPRYQRAEGRKRTKRGDQMAEMRKAGKRYSEIAAAFGVSIPAAHHVCRRRGLTQYMKPRKDPYLREAEL